MTTLQQQRAREARRELGLTREAFAAALGVSTRAAYSWELEGKDSRNPSQAALLLMDRLVEFERMLRDVKKTLSNLDGPLPGPGGVVDAKDRGD